VLFELGDDPLYEVPLRRLAVGAFRGNDGELKDLCETCKLVLFHVGKGAYDGKLTPEHLLVGLHGADLSLEKEVEEHGLYDIVEVVGKGDLLRTDVSGEVEEPLPPVPAAPEAPGIFFYAVPSFRGSDDDIGNGLFLAVVRQDILVDPGKAHVDEACEYLVPDRDKFRPLLHDLEKAETVLAAGDSNDDLIALP